MINMNESQERPKHYQKTLTQHEEALVQKYQDELSEAQTIIQSLKKLIHPEEFGFKELKNEVSTHNKTLWNSLAIKLKDALEKFSLADNAFNALQEHFKTGQLDEGTAWNAIKAEYQRIQVPVSNLEKFAVDLLEKEAPLEIIMKKLLKNLVAPRVQINEKLVKDRPSSSNRVINDAHVDPVIQRLKNDTNTIIQNLEKLEPSSHTDLLNKVLNCSTSFALSKFKPEEGEQLKKLLVDGWDNIKELQPFQNLAYKELPFTQEKVRELEKILDKIGTQKAKSLSKKLLYDNTLGISLYTTLMVAAVKFSNAGGNILNHFKTEQFDDEKTWDAIQAEYQMIKEAVSNLEKFINDLHENHPPLRSIIKEFFENLSNLKNQINKKPDNFESAKLSFTENIEQGAEVIKQLAIGIKQNHPTFNVLYLSNVTLNHNALEKLNEALQNNTVVGRIKWGYLPQTDKADALKTAIEKKLEANNSGFKDRPSDYEYALMSEHVYEKNLQTLLNQPVAWIRDDGKHMALPEGWVLYEVKDDPKTGYFGAAYYHPTRHFMVVAHRGAEPSDLKDLDTYIDIFNKKKDNDQQVEAYKFTKTIAQTAVKKHCRFSITGHSLGGWLAQSSLIHMHLDKSFALSKFKAEEVSQLQALLSAETWTKIKALKPSESDDYKKLPFTFEETDQLKEALEKLNSTEAQSLSAKFVLEYKYPHAVIFDCPGGNAILKQLQPDTLQNRLDPLALDVKVYLAAPNFLNTAHRHLGGMVRIFPELETAWVNNIIVNLENFNAYLLGNKQLKKGKELLKCIETLLRGHNIRNIVDTFDAGTGLPREQLEAINWPKIKLPKVKTAIKNLIKGYAKTAQGYVTINPPSAWDFITLNPTQLLMALVRLAGYFTLEKGKAEIAKAVLKKIEEHPLTHLADFSWAILQYEETLGSFHEFMKLAHRVGNYHPQPFNADEQYKLDYKERYKNMSPDLYSLSVQHLPLELKDFVEEYAKCRRRLHSDHPELNPDHYGFKSLLDYKYITSQTSGRQSSYLSLNNKSTDAYSLRQQLIRYYDLHPELHRNSLTDPTVFDNQFLDNQFLKEQLAVSKALKEQLAVSKALKEQLAVSKALKEQLAVLKADSDHAHQQNTNQNRFLSARQCAPTQLVSPVCEDLRWPKLRAKQAAESATLTYPNSGSSIPSSAARLEPWFITFVSHAIAYWKPMAQQKTQIENPLLQLQVLQDEPPTFTQETPYQETLEENIPYEENTASTPSMPQPIAQHIYTIYQQFALWQVIKEAAIDSWQIITGEAKTLRQKNKQRFDALTHEFESHKARYAKHPYAQLYFKIVKEPDVLTVQEIQAGLDTLTDKDIKILAQLATSHDHAVKEKLHDLPEALIEQITWLAAEAHIYALDNGLLSAAKEKTCLNPWTSRGSFWAKPQNLGSCKKQVGNSGTRYIRHEVSSDGDCGYTAFGITRAEAFKLLSDNITIEDVNGLLSVGVKEALLVDDFLSYLVNYNGMKLSRECVDNNLETLSTNINIIAAYLSYDVKDKKIQAGWAHPAILQALAHIKGIALYVWQLGADEKLTPHLQAQYAAYIPLNRSQRLDLLFVSGNHFERLEFENGIIPKVGAIIYPLKFQKNQNLALLMHAKAALPEPVRTTSALPKPAQYIMESLSP